MSRTRRPQRAPTRCWRVRDLVSEATLSRKCRQCLSSLSVFTDRIDRFNLDFSSWVPVKRSFSVFSCLSTCRSSTYKCVFFSALLTHTESRSRERDRTTRASQDRRTMVRVLDPICWPRRASHETQGWFSDHRVRANRCAFPRAAVPISRPSSERPNLTPSQSYPTHRSFSPRPW